MHPERPEPLPRAASVLPLDALPFDVLRIIAACVPQHPRMAVVARLSKRMLAACRSTVTALPRREVPDAIIGLFPSLLELEAPAATRLPPGLTKLRTLVNTTYETTPCELRSLALDDLHHGALTLVQNCSSSLTALECNFTSRMAPLSVLRQPWTWVLTSLRSLSILAHSHSGPAEMGLMGFIARHVTQLTQLNLHSGSDFEFSTYSFADRLPPSLTHIAGSARTVLRLAPHLPHLRSVRMCVDQGTLCESAVQALGVYDMHLSLTKRLWDPWYQWNLAHVAQFTRLKALTLPDHTLELETLARVSTSLTSLRMGGKPHSRDNMQACFPALTELDFALPAACPELMLADILEFCPALRSLAITVPANTANLSTDLRKFLQRAQKATRIARVRVRYAPQTCTPRNRLELAKLPAEFPWLALCVIELAEVPALRGPFSSV